MKTKLPKQTILLVLLIILLYTMAAVLGVVFLGINFLKPRLPLSQKLASLPTPSPTKEATIQAFPYLDYSLEFHYQKAVLDEKNQTFISPPKEVVYFVDKQGNIREKVFEYETVFLQLIKENIRWTMRKINQEDIVYVTFNLGVAEGSDWYIVRYANKQLSLINIPGNLIGEAMWFNGKLLITSWIYPTDEYNLFIFDPEMRDFITSVGNIVVSTPQP